MYALVIQHNRSLPPLQAPRDRSDAPRVPRLSTAPRGGGGGGGGGLGKKRRRSELEAASEEAELSPYERQRLENIARNKRVRLSPHPLKSSSRAQ